MNGARDLWPFPSERNERERQSFQGKPGSSLSTLLGGHVCAKSGVECREIAFTTQETPFKERRETCADEIIHYSIDVPKRWDTNEIPRSTEWGT